MIYPVHMNECYFSQELVKLRRQASRLNNPVHAVHAQIGKLLIQAEEYLDECQLWSLLSHPEINLQNDPDDTESEYYRLKLRCIYAMSCKLVEESTG